MTDTPTLKSQGQTRPTPSGPAASLDALAARFRDWRAHTFGGGEGGPNKGGGWKRPAYWIGGVLGGLILLLVIFLWLFQWDWLRGPISKFASAKIHREVRIDGHLKVHLLTLTPTVTVEGLKIGQPAWGPKDRRLAEVESIKGAVKLLPLFLLRTEVPLLDIEKPNLVLRTDAEGRSTWDFSDPNSPKTGKPFKLPPIQQLIINAGHIDFKDDKRKITLIGTVNSNERIGSDKQGAFRLKGDGLINNAKFTLNISGGPLINVRKDRPYPFDADLRAGATHMTAQGQITKPFDLGKFDAKLSLSGADLNDIYHITGLALPNTPPYAISGTLRRNEKIYDFTGASGRIGASDIEGRLQVDTTNKRPYLDADLASRSLDFADLAAIFGAPGASKAATAEQKAATKTVTAPTRLLPDATLKIEQLRAMDADVTYRAASIKAPGLPLKNVSIVGNLNEGVLKLNPLTLGFPQGALTGGVTLDGSKATPVTSLDMRLSNVRIEQFLPEQKGIKPVEGTLQARAKLVGAGDSVHKAAAAANGQITAVIPGGQIRQAFAELLGIDATKGLFMLLQKDQRQTDIRCAIADFRVVDGVLRAQRIVIDTGVVVVNGQGQISLKDESIGLKFDGKPTHFRLVRVLAPITVGGHLAKPTFGVQPGGAIVQAGIAVGLTAVLGPLAAILPFVDPGATKNANCAALMQDAKATGAPPSTTLAPPVSAAKVRAAKAR